MNPMHQRVSSAVVGATIVTVLLSGCALGDALIPPVEAALYPTVAEATAPDASIPIPSWVPADATMIRIKKNEKSGDTIMQFTAASQLIGGACDATMAERLPQLQDTWWHQTLPTPENISCFENWHIFVLNGEFNAWTP